MCAIEYQLLIGMLPQPCASTVAQIQLCFLRCCTKVACWPFWRQVPIVAVIRIAWRSKLEAYCEGASGKQSQIETSL